MVEVNQLTIKNAKGSSGVCQAHTVKDVMKFLRENGIKEESLQYVRRTLKEHNMCHSYQNNLCKGNYGYDHKGRFNERAYSVIKSHGEYKMIVFWGSANGGDKYWPPETDPKKILYSDKIKVTYVIPDSRNRTRSGTKLFPKKPRKVPVDRFEDLDHE